MSRNVFYRDFTICKAIALVGLMGLAAALGGVPNVVQTHAQADADTVRIIPAMDYRVWEDDQHVKVGVDL